MNKSLFAEAILAQTNGGLDIILAYYPQARGCETNSSKKFKRRGNERTASAALKKTEDGTWLVHDFGEWNKAKNAISVYIEHFKKIGKYKHMI